MAGDWIKMRTDLYRDPKVSLIAEHLMSDDSDLSRHVNQMKQRNMTVTRNVMRNVTVGALVSIWGVMRHRGKRVDDDLVCYSVTVNILDDIADLPGIGEAMEFAGWVRQDQEGIVFPNFFDEYNSDPVDRAREKNRERQRRFREKKAQEKDNATSNVTVTHREEKRRDKEKVKKESRNSKFKPPSVDQVQEYVETREIKINPQAFVDHYSANGWMRGKAKIKDWKACVRTWEQNEKNNQRSTPKPDGQRKLESVDQVLARQSR